MPSRTHEFMVLTREAEGIVMKIKHFTPNLVGWEEKDDAVVRSRPRTESSPLRRAHGGAHGQVVL